MTTQACPNPAALKASTVRREKATMPTPPLTATDEARADRSSDSKPSKIKYLRANTVTSLTL